MAEGYGSAEPCGISGRIVKIRKEVTAGRDPRHLRAAAVLSQAGDRWWNRPSGRGVCSISLLLDGEAAERWSGTVVGFGTWGPALRLDGTPRVPEVCAGRPLI
jgi:hypothetical protein